MTKDDLCDLLHDEYRPVYTPPKRRFPNWTIFLSRVVTDIPPIASVNSEYFTKILIDKLSVIDLSIKTKRASKFR